jgi:cyclic pyranopterin phosphate synthase
MVHVQATAKTGVEMEAMMAASVGALTVYDMCKSSDRSISITNLRLLNKSGGVRGDYAYDEEA